MSARLNLVSLLLLSFALRIGLPYGVVLGGEHVAFLETDAWYHMRLVDSLVRHFPDRLWFDAYLRHPDGEAVFVGPLFDWLIAGTALVIGAGAPSERLVDVVGAVAPAVLGALTTIPVYVIGRALFSPAAGTFAALLFATMPGGTFRRSLLGYTDHHAGEMLFSSLVLMALVLCLALNAGPFWRRYGGGVAGLALGACLLTWSGAVIVIVVLAGWAGAQVVIERVRGDIAPAAAGPAAAMFMVALVMLAPWAGTTRYFGYQALALVVTIVGLAGLTWLARVTVGRRHGLMLFLAAPTGIVLLAVAGMAVAPDRILALAPDLGRLSPFRTSFVAEATPLIMSPLWRPVPLWTEFTASTFLAVAALALVATEGASLRAAGRVLLLWWTLAMLAATVSQVRFTYYLGIPVAILAGAMCARALSWAGRMGPPAAEGAPAGHWIRRLTAAVLVAITVGPSIPGLRAYTRLPSTPGADWVDTLTWMRYNTEEPFGDPGAYYATQLEPPAAYGVLAWWDMGYWIIRLAHRVPIANPKQSGVGTVSAFLLAEDQMTAGSILEETGTRYVLVDALLPLVMTDQQGGVRGFMPGMLAAAGKNPRDYAEVLFRRIGDEAPRPVMTYSPAYYRTMQSRLYMFEGKAATPPASVSVVTTEPGTVAGRRVEMIVAEETFPSYEDARAALGAERSGRRRIVGWEPWETCVPLEAVRALRVVYRSLGRERRPDGSAGAPVVQVFEYRPASETADSARISGERRRRGSPPG